jgi:hypothetical protein
VSGTLDREGEQPWSVGALKMFVDGIPALPPGKRIMSLFDSSFARKPEVYPDVYDVTVEYTDAAGKKRFADPPITLDLGVYWGLVRIEEAARAW